MERRKDYVDVYGRFKEGRAFFASLLLGLLNTSDSNYFEEWGGGKMHAGMFKIKMNIWKALRNYLLLEEVLWSTGVWIKAFCGEEAMVKRHIFFKSQKDHWVMSQWCN